MSQSEKPVIEHRVTLEKLREGPLRVRTGHVHQIVLDMDVLKSTLGLDQLRGLAEKRGKRFFVPWMSVIFGVDIAQERYEALYDDLLSGALEHPPIKLMFPGQLDGRLGRYPRAGGRIEIDRELAYEAARGSNESAWCLAACLVEEFGHHIDYVLRGGVGDAKGDEGARYGYSLLNLGWNEGTSAQIGTYEHRHSGETLPVVVDWSDFDDVIEQLLGAEEQASDDQDDRGENFGAGRLNHQHNPHSWGHRAIEEAVLRARDVDREQAKEIYFGNWLRDYSQVITPDTIQLFSAQTLTRALHYLGHGEFGQQRKFDVTPDLLGQYRYEEHMDHPYGNQSADPASYVVDSQTWIPHYMRSASGSVPNALSRHPVATDYMVEQLGLAVAAGRNPVGHRHLGQALHTLEDYYAHSNFAELSLIRAGHAVFPWTALRTEDDIAPVVTGTFGGLDTAASVILGIAHHLERARECDFYASEPAWWMKAAFTLLGDLLEGADGLTKADLSKEWNQHADRLQHFVHHAYAQGWIDDDPIVHAAHRSVVRVVGYLQCRVAALGTKFGAALLAIAADRIAREAMAHEVHFDGSVESVLRDVGDEMGHLQTAVAGAGAFPTHTQLAKDHEHHPLHDLAARMAVLAVGRVYDAVDAAWDASPNAPEPREVALGFIVHPHRISSDSVQQDLVALAHRWASENSAKVRQAGDLRWVQQHDEHWQHVRDETRQLLQRVVRGDRVDTLVEELEGFLGEGQH